jgi:hypothetical protein
VFAAALVVAASIRGTIVSHSDLQRAMATAPGFGVAAARLELAMFSCCTGSPMQTAPCSS